MASSLQGLEDLLARITTLQQLRNTRGALLLGGADIKTHMQAYPPAVHITRKSVYGRSFQSDRQRRWFFWALKKGKVPYRRTMALAKRWTVRAFNNGLTVEIGNTTPYGPGVQGEGTQWRMMRMIGWRTDEAVLTDRGPIVVQYIRSAIEADVAGGG